MKSRFKLPKNLAGLADKVIASRRYATRTTDWLRANSAGLTEVHELLAAAIQGGRRFSAVRPGGTESEGIRQVLQKGVWLPRRNSSKYSEWFQHHAPVYSGITWKEEQDLDEFVAAYFQGLLGADLLSFGRFAPGSLNVTAMLALAQTSVCPAPFVHPLTAILAGTEPWSLSLEGKKVLVIHPFEDSIRSQYDRRNHVYPLREILPTFSLLTLRPPITFAKEVSSLTWMQNFSGLQTAVSDIDFDVALVGAGAYGLPITDYIKKGLGRVAIHLGGSLQLLFGITGSRYERNRDFNSHITQDWVRPLASETPKGAGSVEGAAYW